MKISFIHNFPVYWVITSFTFPSNASEQVDNDFTCFIEPDDDKINGDEDEDVNDSTELVYS